MNDSEWPSPYEIARIAAALGDGQAGKNPEQAAIQALNLWFAAEREIHKEKMRYEAAKSAKWTQQHKAPLDPGSQTIPFSLDSKGNSPAMEWVNEHAKTEHDKFKSFREFQIAWVKFQPIDAHYGASEVTGDLKCLVEDLNRFLDWRSERRKDQYRTQKRNQRAANRQGKKVVK